MVRREGWRGGRDGGDGEEGGMVRREGWRGGKDGPSLFP